MGLYSKITSALKMKGLVHKALVVWPYVFAGMVYMLAPAVESALLPVVKDFVVTKYERKDDHIVASGYMRKIRSCQFIGVQATTEINGETVDLPINFQDNVISNATRPVGTQAWGPWKVYIPNVKGQVIKLTSTHRCHFLYSTDTVLTELAAD